MGAPRFKLLLLAVAVAWCGGEDAGDADYGWAENVGRLEAFVEREGHADVPADAPHLGPWLRKQRAAMGESGGAMTPERRQTLRRLGVVRAGGLGGEKWERRAAAVADYRQVHGADPGRTTVDEAGIDIGRWLTAQKVRASMGQLDEDRLARLRAMGVALKARAAPRPGPPKPPAPKPPAPRPDPPKPPAPRPDPPKPPAPKPPAPRPDPPKPPAPRPDPPRPPAPIKAAGPPAFVAPVLPSVVPPDPAARREFLLAQLAAQTSRPPAWFAACGAARTSRAFRFRPADRAPPFLWNDEQFYHILCLVHGFKLAKNAPLRVVQVGANDGDDAFYRALLYAREHYPEVPVEAVLVEPTPRNFERLEKRYRGSPLAAGATFLRAAVCDDCCSADGTTAIYHPRWALLAEWYQHAIDFPEQHPNAFKTADGTWRQKWLYELNSLDPTNLRGHFKDPKDIQSTTIDCSSLAAIVDGESPNVDYVMVDVEGYDYEVLRSLALSRQRPAIITFESKIMEGKRPDALYAAAKFCIDHGYHAIRAGANYVCVRLDDA